MASEQQGFVFAVSFLLLLSALLISMPAALQGSGGTAQELRGVDPDLITGFSDTVNWTPDAMSSGVYTYDIGGYHWYFRNYGSYMYLDRRILFLEIFWFGAVEHTEFVLANGTNRGSHLTWADIQGDSEDGSVRYNLRFTDNGNDAGGFVFYWNATLYPDPEDAYDNSVMNYIHGVGIDSTAATNIFTLLLQLLTFQIPGVPVIVGVLLAAPVWASIAYLLWFIITGSLPFFSGG
jgi:hypothetical protein